MSYSLISPHLTRGDRIEAARHFVRAFGLERGCCSEHHYYLIRIGELDPHVINIRVNPGITDREEGIRLLAVKLVDELEAHLPSEEEDG